MLARHSGRSTSSPATAQEEAAFVRRHLKRNTVAQLLNGMFGQTGFRLVAAPTFLPAFLFGLSGSELVVGAARSLQGVGTVVSPFIGASIIGHRPRVLKTMLTTNALMRVQILGMSLAAFFLAAEATVNAFMVLMTLMGFFQGISQVATHLLRAKVIPVNRRGIISGARHFLAGLVAAGAAWVCGSYFLAQNVLGNGYGTIFLLAFFVAALGLASMLITREPVARYVRPRESTRRVLVRVVRLMRADPAFARFFTVRALGSFGNMAMPFYILFAYSRMEVTDAQLGLVTMVWMLVQNTTSLAWGAIADRMGNRVVLIATLGIWIAAHVYLMFLQSMFDLVLFFAVVGFASGGFHQSGQNMVLEFGRSRDVALRLATSGTAVNFFAAAGPILGGLIVSALSYIALFLITIAVQVAALVIMIRWVPEPRRSVTA